MPRNSLGLHRNLLCVINKSHSLAAIGVLAAVLLLASCTPQGEEAGKPAQKTLVARPTTVYAAEAPDAAQAFSTAIERVAEQTIPAVVHIDVTERREVVNPWLPFQNDPFFRHFFGMPRMPRKFKREFKGLGTGMIMDPEGHILTNNHVAGGATKIEVLLASGKRYPAKLVGADPKTDLAVIKISAKEPLPHVTFGDSDRVKVGAWVVAIGHPRGLDQTVTQGIISAKHRTGIMDPSTYQDFLQTDAAINPGNSGGPLLNLKGEVIGVNAAIVSQSGGFEGIGFAIPSNMALHIAKQLIAYGEVQRGWLGVSIQDLSPELAKKFGMNTGKGALISDVVKGGPAEEAHMRRGDIVLKFAGKEIKDASSLRNQVAVAPPGSKAKVVLWRDRKKVKLTVKVGNIKDMTKMLSASVKERLGGEVRQVTSKEARKYGLQRRQGVVLEWVEPGGPLGQVGFEVGDIILEINGERVSDVTGLATVLRTIQPGQAIALLALDHRTGNTGYVQVVVR